MLEFLLATIISLSASVWHPQLVPSASFDYEFSCQIENTYKGFDGTFKQDYERQDEVYVIYVKGRNNIVVRREE